jgi:hypothetical protein
MKGSRLTIKAAVLASVLISAPAWAQAGHPTLHVNPRWKECSFQLDSALSPAAWRQFTREAGLVTYFRPLVDAKPMGKGKFEVAMLQWDTGIDDHDSAWNDTFVHPDSAHWLFEGSGLKFPGLTVRAGVSNSTDLGLYLTKNPNANYGFVGGQMQRSLIGNSTSTWAAATRVSFTTMFGPQDLDFASIGWDLVASREIRVANRVAISPYAGVSSYLARSHEKSAVVDLKDAYQGGSQLMVGTVLRLTAIRLAVEYNQASVHFVSMKVGLGR